jgi:hypothetical protein
LKSNAKTLIQATSTPLASIFGSGFLIIVPILAGVVGELSVFAIAGVCVLAYVVGSVIRFNIRNAEPVLADKPPESTLALERTSDLALAARLSRSSRFPRTDMSDCRVKRGNV